MMMVFNDGDDNSHNNFISFDFNARSPFFPSSLDTFFGLYCCLNSSIPILIPSSSSLSSNSSLFTSIAICDSMRCCCSCLLLLLCVVVKVFANRAEEWRKKNNNNNNQLTHTYTFVYTKKT